MVELKTNTPSHTIGELDPTESKCLTCEYLEGCKKDPEFDPDKVDGCADYLKAQAKTSAVVE